MPQPASTHEICPAVQDMYGMPPDMELMKLDGHEDGSAANDILSQLELRNCRTTDGSDIENGKAARRAIVAQDCGHCVLREHCEVETALEEAARDKHAQSQLAAKNRSAESELQANVTMLAQGSNWLTQGRITRLIHSGFNPKRISRLFSHPDELTEEVQSGKITIDTLRGGVKNELIGFVSKQSIPEISGSEHFKDEAIYPIEQITTDTGHVFEVIDASIGNTHREAKIPKTAYSVLVHKLLIMIASDGKGDIPQIFNAEGTKLSLVHSVTPPKGSHYYEIRMASKNRMYISVTRNNGDKPSRIVIFGAHGGDEQAQDKFIRAILTSTPRLEIPAQRNDSQQKQLLSVR